MRGERGQASVEWIGLLLLVALALAALTHFASLELRRLRPAADLTRQARRGFVRVWQRAWIACLFYERIRYNLLHPESRIPGHRIPASEVLRMLDDCISPVDLVRDWPLLDGR
jgi:hypothetical protein